MAVVRKSSRLTKSGEQSRITEFVNVRKRATIQATLKKNSVDLFEVKESPVVLTPMKGKTRKSGDVVEEVKSGAVETVKVNGLLTPSPSLESVQVKSAQVTKEEPAPAYKRFAHLVDNVRNQKPKLDSETTETCTTEKCTTETSEKCEIVTTETTDTQSFTETSSVCDHKFVPWLPLNEKWSMYEKIIFNVDNLCVLAAGRSQPCVFHKIQKTLENVLGKQVPLDQMGRLKTLWPEAYEYRESRVVMQGKRVDSVAIVVPGITGTGSSAALLNERKEEVRSRVQKYLINAHQNLFFPDGKSGIVPKEWHSKFDQNSVEDLHRTPLLNTVNNLNVPERPSTPKLINEIIAQSPIRTGTAQVVTAEIPSTNSTKMSLLERIRAKEQKLQTQKCFGSDPETARLEAILSQMDRFTQSVMFTFSSSKKTSLFLSDLTTKLMQSAGTPLGAAEVLERLKLLERAAPEWIKIVEGGETTPKHVKILDKTRSLNSIIESIKTMKRNNF